jgi:hypothetical protein
MELDMVPDLTHEVLLQMGFIKAGPRIRIMRLREVIINPKNGESTSASPSSVGFFQGVSDLCLPRNLPSS